MNSEGSTPSTKDSTEKSNPLSITEMTRRVFIKRMALAGAGVLLPGGAAAWSTQIEPNWIEIKRVALSIRGLHPAFENWTLAQVSDLHIGGWMTRERLQNVVDLVNGLRPDLIAITGDFVTRAPQGHSAVLTQVLSTFQARRDVFGVLGNHDHWTHAGTIKKTLKKSGVQELDNSFHTIRKDGGTVHLCGVDDAWAGAADVSRVLQKLPKKGAAILLAHEPDFADDYAKAGRFDVQLSGHTHGGQIRVPGVGPLILPSYGEKYHTGRYRIQSTPSARGLTLYVNRGVGMVWPYVRFYCRPEITLFTLRAL